MGTKEFGQLADAARRHRGYSLARVAVGVGVLPDGGVLNETQVKRILEGRRALDTFLVERLIAVLDLDRAEAWEAALESADLKPPGLTADMLRKLELVATSPMTVSPGKVAVLPIDDGLDDQIRRLRPQLVMAGETRAGSSGSGQYGPVGPTASLDPLRQIRPAGEATPVHAPHSSEAIPLFTRAPYPGARAYPKVRPPRPRVDRRQRDRRRLHLVPDTVAA